MVFRQLFDPASSTYTYLLADEATKEAVLVDPVFEWVQRDLALVRELGLRLTWVLETHVHADHITGASALKATKHYPKFFCRAVALEVARCLQCRG
jgi:glyoxylase-like metal-dependent hydrolase (beta-lactamase superfamily II)